ncbi:MAG: DUF5666 domain-containing protein [Acidobacteriaceae bacterium]
MFEIGSAQKAILTAALASATLWTSCGYGSGTMYTPPPSGTSAALINVTDAPSDRVLSFALTIDSIMLVASDGSGVVVSNAPHRVEVTHTSGSAEPLAVTVIPQGTFTAARIAVSSPDVSFISLLGDAVQKNNVGGATTVNIPFAQPLVVGATPMVLTLDFDAAGSITIDTATNAVTVNPVATIRTAQVPGSGGEAGEDAEDGEFEHFVGQVTTVSGSNFTAKSLDTTVMFATDTNTEFNVVNGVQGLANRIVRVEATTKPDGTPLAKEVEVLSAAGGEVEGLINMTTGSPEVTSFSIVVQDGAGTSVPNTLLGGFITATINAETTQFRVDNGNIELGGLNLPAFNRAFLSKGQRVEIDAVEGSTGSNITADSVKLVPQALTGSITNASNTGFSLTVANDSAFQLLSGIGTLQVLTQQNTEFKNGASITNGATVRVRGLVYFNAIDHSFTMVAGRISTP